MSDDEPLRIAWIGAGIMGVPMCGHLLAAGHPVTVFSRRRITAASLLERGAVWADTPAAAAAGADVAITMVGYPADVRTVVLGPDGTLQGAAPGALLVDMSTSEPALAVEIEAAARRRGVASLDAPVSGGEVGAKDAALTIMVGGDEAAYARVLPVLQVLAARVTRMGGPGSGQHTKMTNQIAIASGMVAICEALVYAAAAGLDPDQAIEAIQGGAAGSWSLTNYGPRMVRGDFAPGFKIDHFVKDLGIALAESERMGLTMPGLTLAHQVYEAAQSHGAGERGIQALVLTLAQLSDREWPPTAST
jgi:3-hydroxyisobutyrate dehydrogenase